MEGVSTYLWIVTSCFCYSMVSSLPSESVDEWNTLGNLAYKFVSTSVTWHAANDSCSNLNAQLVIIENSQQSGFVAEMASSVDRIWIGLTDSDTEGTFVWINGQSPNAYKVWANNSKNDDEKDCTEQRVKTITWRVRQCNRKRPYVCQRALRCLSLSSPMNGHIVNDNATVGSHANYSCNDGYRLDGPATRLCMGDGKWSGSEPSCQVDGCGSINVTNGDFQFNGTNYGDVALVICDSGYHLSGSTISQCLLNGTWSDYGQCVGDFNVKFGLKPKFTITPKTQAIRSPLLLWNDQNSYIKFSYELSRHNRHMKVLNVIKCYTDLAGRQLSGSGPTRTPDRLTPDGKNGVGCIKIIDVNCWSECRTFRVKTEVEVKFGVVTISDLEFGDESICLGPSEPKTNISCQFENSDCGLRNDGCGLVDWEIRSNDAEVDRRRRSAHCPRHRGVPLLKKETKSSCSYEHLNIVDMQPSGYSVEDVDDDEDDDSGDDDLNLQNATVGNVRMKRSSDYSIYLDPSGSSGVAIGFLDLPEVRHAKPNSFLEFVFEMTKNGKHDLMITAVCTSDRANSLVPLHGHVHYHKTHLDGRGLSGRLCLDIHKYVLQEDCSTFAIQLQAAAVESMLVIDDIYFASTLASTRCFFADNAQ